MKITLTVPHYRILKKPRLLVGIVCCLALLGILTWSALWVFTPVTIPTTDTHTVVSISPDSVQAALDGLANAAGNPPVLQGTPFGTLDATTDTR